MQTPQQKGWSWKVPRVSEARLPQPDKRNNVMVNLLPDETACIHRFKNGALYIHRFNGYEKADLRQLSRLTESYEESHENFTGLTRETSFGLVLCILCIALLLLISSM